ncbi:LysR family transcriptional regulator [Paenibacillus sp. LMG 31456]|uniref:LysR family transcriptional regulator n=1 Tax=Paenibacillus foliorum TaxID=2654974 RepID=A0A972GXR1_9BACL|nr:LysR substrate-binding domain-containing protein [Paenibacillus foliorum]NOU96108.1 LysR family transcriptional regulator [Paenibacillus foliorum]
MEHRLLEYFIAVCEELHFTRAAERLGISQSTLSHQIQLLEHRVGAPLLTRIGKKTYISEAGELLLKHSRNAFHELDQAQAAINELSSMQRGRLRIGCSGNHLLTSAMISFHKQFPGVELSVTELATDETKEGLLTNQLDIGVVFLPFEDDLLESITLYNEELQLVVSDRSSLADAQCIEMKELQSYPILMLQKKFLVRQMMDNYCTEHGFLIKPILELSTLDSLLQMAKSNIGGAVLPRSYLINNGGPDIRPIPIIDPVPHKSVGIVYRKETYMCASIQTFIRELRNSFEV